MAEISIYVVVRLWPIFSYNQLGYPKLADDASPQKSEDIFVFDGGEGFSFYQFIKIVDGN